MPPSKTVTRHGWVLGPWEISGFTAKMGDADAEDQQNINTTEQSFFLQVKIYMKVDLHMVGCRQFAGVRRLA